jgi:lysophospholipase-1
VLLSLVSTHFGGTSDHSRFDIYSFGFNAAEDEVGMMTSVELINELIKEEIHSGIDPSRIVLGGFSQGAAMTLLTALTSGFKLAGVVCLSGWLPLQHKINEVRYHSITFRSSLDPVFFFAR